jgi:predicted phosphodiesterase
LFRNGTINWDDAGDILKSVLLFDIHHPNHDLACMDAVNQFLADYQPDEIVYGGDQLSLDVVSTWNKNKPKLVEKERIKKDCEKFDKEVLKRHERICPDARRVFMYGNHEERLRWFVEQIPAVEGLVEVENVLQLQDRGYIVIPFNEVYRIGKLRVVHGFYWNVYHASKTAQAFESNVAYGHVHDHQTFTKISPVDRNDYHMATSIPCLSTSH